MWSLLLRSLLSGNFLRCIFFCRLCRNWLYWNCSRLLVAFLDPSTLLLRLLRLRLFSCRLRFLNLFFWLIFLYRNFCCRSGLLLYRFFCLILFLRLSASLFRLVGRSLSRCGFYRRFLHFSYDFCLNGSSLFVFLCWLFCRFFNRLLCSLLFLRSAALLSVRSFRSVLCVDSRFVIKNRIDQIILLHFLESFYFKS